MKTAICSLVLAMISVSGLQAGTAPGLDAVRVASGLTQPLFVTAPPGDFRRLFIVQQDGNIRILNLLTGTLNSTPFPTLTGLTDTTGEQGLLGMAFDPNYATNGKFYLNFTVPGGAFGNGVTHVSQFSVTGNPDIADPNSERILITFDHPEANHNGGWIGFSPRTGDANNLYIATGDGGAGNDQGTGHIEPGGNAQNLTTLLGKMLRIHVNSAAGTATIPSNNPFVGISGARGEIWAFGLRNPFRNSFDRQTGRMFIGDVGQARARRSTCNKQQMPVAVKTMAGVSAKGAYKIPPSLDHLHRRAQSIRYLIIRIWSVKQSLEVMFIAETEFRICVGSMFLGISSAGQIFSFDYDGRTVSNFQTITSQLFPTSVGGFTLSHPSSLGEDANGELYITDMATAAFSKSCLQQAGAWWVWLTLIRTAIQITSCLTQARDRRRYGILTTTF